MKRGIYNNPLLESIEGMRYVESIFDMAFRDCPKLARVDYPSEVKPYFIGQSLFSGDSEMWKTFEVVEDAYYWGNVCLGIKYNVTNQTGNQSTLQKEGVLRVKNGTVCIASYAFKNMKKITEFQLPDSVKATCYYPFMNCTALTKVNIPASLYFGCGNPFYACSKLAELTVPKDFNETNRYYRVTDGCLISKDPAPILVSALPSVTAIPDGVAVVGTYSMSYTAAKTVEIPGSVTSIGSYAFYNGAIESVVIPDSVGTLADTAFYSAKNLTSITFGKSVPKLTQKLFTNSKSAKIETIEVSAENKSMSARENVLFDKNAEEVIYCAPTKTGVYELPETVNKMFAGAFTDTKIEIFVVPEGVTAIGAGCFRNNKSLREIVLPYSLTGIGDGAFDGCGNLVYVTRRYTASKLRTIGARAFQNAGLTEFFIPENVTTIGDGAFSGTALTEAAIPDSVVSVGGGALPESVRTLSLGAGVETFGKNGDNAGLFDMTLLASLTVSAENQHFSTEDLVLYDKTKTELLGFAPTISELLLPDTIVTDVLGDFSYDLPYCEKLTKIVFGAGSYADSRRNRLHQRLHADARSAVVPFRRRHPARRADGNPRGTVFDHDELFRRGLFRRTQPDGGKRIAARFGRGVRVRESELRDGPLSYRNDRPRVYGVPSADVDRVAERLDAKTIPQRAFSNSGLYDADGYLERNGTVVDVTAPPAGTRVFCFRDGTTSINADVLCALTRGG